MKCRRSSGLLAIVDDFSRECLALVADASLSGLLVTRELTAIMVRRGRPKIIVSDNGTELTSMAVLRWCQETRIDWHYIAPGKPMQSMRCLEPLFLSSV
jgi:putative transposase